MENHQKISSIFIAMVFSNTIIPLIILLIINLSSCVKIYLKPEAPKYGICVYCGKNREKLVLEFGQSGIQNVCKEKDKKFLQFDRKHLEMTNCNEKDQEVVIDALFFKKVNFILYRHIVGCQKYMENSNF